MSEHLAVPEPADAVARHTRRAEDRVRVTPPPPTARLELQRRAASTLRGHLLRASGRVAVLLIADLAAFALLRELYRSIGEGALLGKWISSIVESLLPSGYLNGWQFAIALVLGLGVTGNYGAGDRSRAAARLLWGSALAAALPLWAPLWQRDVGLVFAQFAVTTIIVGIALLAIRSGLYAIDARLPQRTRTSASSRTLLIGSHAECTSLAERAGFAEHAGHRLLGFVDTAAHPAPGALGALDALPGLIQHHHVESVVICGRLNDGELHEVVDHAITAGCDVFSIPRIFAVPGVQPRVVWKRGQALVELTAQTLKAQQFAIKRVVDLAGAVLGLVLLAPVLLLLAAIIRLDSPGPAIFRHRRIGTGGRPFWMLKFRTMMNGAEEMKPLVAHLNHSGDPRFFKIPNDPRVSRVGRWMRRWSVDELPQLWNVLYGEMSLVGPRPFPESDFMEYQVHHFARLGAKPGITGLWQVSGRSDIADFEEVVALDTMYVREWSVLLDVKILLKTIPAVIRRNGAV